MAGFARAKRVTGPLNDIVKALIVGKTGREPVYASSGSEHGGEEEYSSSSPSLSELIHGFLEDDAVAVELPDHDSDSERDPPMCDQNDVIEGLVNTYVTMSADSFRNSLAAHVSNATTAFNKSSSVKHNKLVLRRAVMSSLRDLGYNAAICKTRWESSGGLTAGNYEFIDVVKPDSATSLSRRYFVDLDFVAEFEIARPSDHYERLLEKLPRVFVGRSEDLKEVVKVMSEAAKRSLKGRGLSMPPWRKNRYMQNKWFGSYRRTANEVPANAPASVFLTGSAVKCRSVGFDAVNGRLLFPAATTRTR